MSRAQQQTPWMYRLATGAQRALGDGPTARLARSPLSRPLRRVLSLHAPKEPQVVEITGGALRGMRMLIDLSSERYYWLGTHEPTVQALLQREVAPDSVAWDIGAHAGFFTLLMARRVGPEGRVYAFEPVDRNAERLEENLALNGITHAVVCPAAASDACGFADFTDGATTLEGRLGQGGALRVETVTVDSAVAAGCAAPDLIKIDVEGAEASVVAGARATIASLRPRMLIEVHSRAAAADVAAAMPVPYTYTDLASGRTIDAPQGSGHYYAVAVEGRE